MTAAGEANPTVARRKLAVYFRQLREQQQVSLGIIAQVLGVDRSQASRLDTGARGFQVEDVQKLARWYGLDDADRTLLVALAEEQRRRAWWQQYDLDPAVRTLIGMEQAALSIAEYASSVIPGMLQTRDYAVAVASGARGVLDVDQQRLIDAVEVRMRRQRVFDRTRPPELWTVIDEAALARAQGNAEVMRGQLEHLHARATEPGITVQVIGFEYGPYPSGDHFILLHMGGLLSEVLYTDSLHKPTLTTDVQELRGARRLWDGLRALSLSPRDSAERIKEYLDRVSP